MSGNSTSGFLTKTSTSIFGGLVALRGMLYDRSLLPVETVDGLVVVSVGNIRSGGSGKTPLTIYLANRLKERGVKTAILLRGYKGALERVGGLVSLGKGPIVSPKEAGDEAYLASLLTEDVFVWVGAKREEGARFVRELGVEVALIDDGFQRRGLHRDLDIVLVCPQDTMPGTEMLPSGPLRETPDTLGRAHIVGGLADDWDGVSDKPDLLLEYIPKGFVAFDSRALVPLVRLRGSRAYLVTGIARPERFNVTAKSAGVEVVGSSDFGDHHKFTSKEITSANRKANEQSADLILTTEKDLVRMKDVESDLPIYGLAIDVRIKTGASLIEQHLFVLYK